jgi:hypothetical protein
MKMLVIAVTVVGLAAAAWLRWGAEVESRLPEWKTRAAHFLNRVEREAGAEVDRRARELIDFIDSPEPSPSRQSV